MTGARGARLAGPAAGTPAAARLRAGAARLLRASPRKAILSVTTVIAMVLAWIGMTATGLANPLFLPGPAAVSAAFVETALDGYLGNTLAAHVGISVARILVAFAAAVLVGVPLGILMGVSRDARAMLNPVIEFYRPLPPLGLYTLLVMWLGIGEESKFALLFLAGLPAIVISTIQAIESVDPVHRRAALALGAGPVTPARAVSSARPETARDGVPT